jgi:hypothetical protein
MKLKKLAEIINREFGEPFNPKGTVRAIYHKKDDTLEIFIGRRDIHINDKGIVIGAGTELLHGIAES